MTKTLALILAASLFGGCGDEQKTVPRGGVPGAAKKTDATNPGTSAPAGAARDKGKGAGKIVLLQPYPKVSDEFRQTLEKADFAPDPSGDLNRDPFRSYLIDLSQAMGKAKRGEMINDECEEKGIVAENYGLRDLKLMGIVLRGSKSYALFTDSQNLGHTANRGDCLSKERARVKDIGADRVTLEIRGQAPPGAPAPPPREEVWKVYPQELELDSQTGGGKR